MLKSACRNIDKNQPRRDCEEFSGVGFSLVSVCCSSWSWRGSESSLPHLGCGLLLPPFSRHLMCLKAFGQPICTWASATPIPLLPPCRLCSPHFIVHVLSLWFIFLFNPISICAQVTIHQLPLFYFPSSSASAAQKFFLCLTGVSESLWCLALVPAELRSIF